MNLDFETLFDQQTKGKACEETSKRSQRPSSTGQCWATGYHANSFDWHMTHDRNILFQFKFAVISKRYSFKMKW